MAELKLHIAGKPVPYVRMTQRGKFVDPAAKRYLASKEAIALQLRSQMRGREPFGREPLVVALWFHYVDGADHRRDLDNEIKAVLDAANGIVYEDDRWIDVVQAMRAEPGDQDEVLMVVDTLGAMVGEVAEAPASA